MRTLLPLLLSFAAPFTLANEFETLRVADPDGLQWDGFGLTVATDGHYVAIRGGGATMTTNPWEGAVHLYDALTGERLAIINHPSPAPSMQFGTSLAFQDDTLLIGAPYSSNQPSSVGSMHRYDLTSGHIIGSLTPAQSVVGSLYGECVAANDQYVLVGAPEQDGTFLNSGAVFVFSPSGQQLAMLEPNDPKQNGNFGSAVAVQGNTALIGARSADGTIPGSGAAYTFDLTTMSQSAKYVAPDETSGAAFGRRVAFEQDQAIIGAVYHEEASLRCGAVYHFDTSTGAFVRKYLPTSPQSWGLFGCSVAFDGNRLLIGEYHGGSSGTGSVYLYDTGSGALLETLAIRTPTTNEDLGRAVAMTPGFAVVGAPIEMVDGVMTGAAYFYRLDDLGTSYCPATPNSTGFVAETIAVGSTSLAANDLTLTARPLPSSFYQFYYGDAQIQVPFGNGLRCVGGATNRIGSPSVAVGNQAALDVDLPSAGLVSPGVYHFQCWFRDPQGGGAAFDLSDARSLTFVP